MSVKKCYKVFFQNSGDCDFFKRNRMIRENYEILPGSGCNMDEHAYCEMLAGDDLKFIFIGRVMRLKGIDEYLACAKKIKAEFPSVTFYIAGWNEEDAYKQIVADYEKCGAVKYIGFRKDISEWIKNAIARFCLLTAGRACRMLSWSLRQQEESALPPISTARVMLLRTAKPEFFSKREIPTS